MNHDLNKIAEEIRTEAYKNGYQKGQEDALSAINRAVEQMSLSSASLPSPLPPLLNGGQQRVEPSFREGSTMALVHEFIKENQGHAGIEIVNGLIQGGHKTEERTIRTALHRLKDKKVVTNRDGKWFIR